MLWRVVVLFSLGPTLTAEKEFQVRHGIVFLHNGEKRDS